MMIVWLTREKFLGKDINPFRDNRQKGKTKQQSEVSANRCQKISSVIDESLFLFLYIHGPVGNKDGVVLFDEVRKIRICCLNPGVLVKV